jgi:predicted nuclease of predicted toxin-antitoxin system
LSAKKATALRVFLDAGVPDAVGHVFEKAGYGVIYYRHALPEKTADEVVCATALANDAILVAQDSDMKRLAKQYGITPKGERFDRLSIIRLCCPEPQAAKRLQQALSLIELEWTYAKEKAARRLWVDVGPHHIRTNR